jgi:transcriptional regulator with XRE-family HTH domain
MEIADSLQQFAPRLVQERHRLCLSQVDLARVGQVTKQTQMAYEQGDRVPGLEYLMRVSEAGLDFTYLVWGVREGEHIAESFNWELLAMILEEMNRWALDNDLELEPRKRVKFSQALYVHLHAKDRVEPQDVVRFLQLVA